MQFVGGNMELNKLLNLNHVIILLALIICLFFVSSCATTTYIADEKTQKICIEKKYDAEYRVTLFRKQFGKTEEERIGQATLTIDKCLLSINDTRDATLNTGDVSLWESVKGIVEADGNLYGKMRMDVLFGKYAEKSFAFSGNMHDMEFKTIFDDYDVIIRMKRK